MNNIIKNIILIMTTIVVLATAVTIFAADTSNESVDDADTSVRTSVSDVTESTTQSTTKKQTFKPYSRYIKDKKTVIREKPNKNAKVVKRYNLGKKVKITASKGNWRKVGKGKWVHKSHLCKKDPTPRYKGVKLKYSGKYNITKDKLTRGRGVCYYNGYKETWYSSKEYGQSQTAYHIPGKHLAKDGTYRDKDGYICVAASTKYAKHTRFMTSLGPAKVYDRGVSGNVIDIYTNW